MKGDRPLAQLFLARLREFFREPETIFWVYVFPVLLLAGLGAAFQGGGERRFDVRIAAPTVAEVQELRSRLLEAAGEDLALRLKAVPLERAEGDRGAHEQDLTVIARGGELEYRFDPARSESVLAHLVIDRALQDAAGRSDPVPSSVEPVRARGSRYVDWLLPGLLGLNIMGGGLWGVGFVTVDMRIRKLLKRFLATPMRRRDFLLSLIGTRLIFLVPETAALLLVGWIFFGFTLAGNILSVAAVVLIGASAFASLGLLLACRARRLETISGLLNATMIPMWIFSGVFFSSERFPDVLQPFVQALPLTQLNTALRGVALEAHGLGEEWRALVILSLWCVVCFPLALRWFRWT